MKRRKLMAAVAGAFLVAFAGLAAWGPIVSNVEQAKYTVVEKISNIEIRDYMEMVVAENRQSGERRQTINSGFRKVAGYIFGGNSETREIAMTAPVMQQRIETAGDKPGEWSVRFVMPSEHTMETLPRPSDSSVTVSEVGPARYAVIRFSGMAHDDDLSDKLQRLRDFIKERKLAEKGEPVYAFFNPPWTLPFLRRNEIMIEVQ